MTSPRTGPLTSSTRSSARHPSPCRCRVGLCSLETTRGSCSSNSTRPGSAAIASRSSESELPVNLPDWLLAEVGRVEDILMERAGASPSPLVAESATHLIKAGGKRVRPALVLLASRSGTPRLRATDLAAAAIALVHLATLYHDDVIDETDTRRGV